MWLAERTAELGHPISRTAISEYETGKRKAIPVTDLIVIGAALEVPPLQLLYPMPSSTEVAYLPGMEELSIVAALTFSGELSTVDKTGRAGLVMQLARRWHELHREVVGLKAQSERVKASPDLLSDDEMENLLPGQSLANRIRRADEERTEVWVAISRLIPEPTAGKSGPDA